MRICTHHMYMRFGSLIDERTVCIDGKAFVLLVIPAGTSVYTETSEFSFLRNWEYKTCQSFELL